MSTDTISPPVFNRRASAKINLYLHVMNKREDGYHDLDLLIAFADFGDEITVQPSDELSLHINGNFSSALSSDEKTLGRSSKNILAKTLWALADYKKREPLLSITLTKNIPLGAGLGGGSADAAALAHILSKIWNINSNTEEFNDILFSLGADVPVCFYSQTCRITGTGQEPLGVPQTPKMHAVLIHPNQHCSTAAIFRDNDQFSSDKIDLPDQFKSQEQMISFLKETRNDLTKAACKNCPDIAKTMDTLNQQDYILLSRMSGSGSTCFGLFGDLGAAKKAANTIKSLHPEWWAQAVTIS